MSSTVVVLAPLVATQLRGGLCKAFRVGVRINEVLSPTKQKVVELRLAATDHEDIRRQLHLMMHERRWKSVRTVALIEEPDRMIAINGMLDAEHVHAKRSAKFGGVL